MEGGKAAGGRAGSRGPRTAVLSVHNTGSYIPPEEVERVFERFYQVDKARAGTRGSGFGRGSGRKIGQAHGGKIDLQSSPKAGTRFTVRIPALEMGAATSLNS